ncbi:CAP domain-containing protein [Alkalibacillus haloalkaliphilus]|uniref:CAP domain-containing protein n=1 Tax=Alkalibacillus haloalkaliphilus TaxID=94136 RepID=UPI0002FA54E9|nr:CAP domain-containing protein [Alkalibacillus haloalkaliphilus]
MLRPVLLTLAAIVVSAVLVVGPVQADESTSPYEITYEVKSQSNQQSLEFNIQEINSFFDQLEWDFNWNQQPTEQEEEEVNEPTEPVEQPQEPTEDANEPEQETENNESNQEESTNDDSSNNDVHEFEQQVVNLVNEEREQRGLQPLELSGELSDVARAKSQDMADENYFSHQSPTYGSPFDMMDHYGVDYRTAGENIAMGQRSPEAVMQGWMNSDGHRENILSDQFTHIGVGYVEGNGSTYWTQMFKAQ